MNGGQAGWKVSRMRAPVGSHGAWNVARVRGADEQRQQKKAVTNPYQELARDVKRLRRGMTKDKQNTEKARIVKELHDVAKRPCPEHLFSLGTTTCLLSGLDTLMYTKQMHAQEVAPLLPFLNKLTIAYLHEDVRGELVVAHLNIYASLRVQNSPFLGEIFKLMKNRNFTRNVSEDCVRCLSLAGLRLDEIGAKVLVMVKSVLTEHGGSENKLQDGRTLAAVGKLLGKRHQLGVPQDEFLEHAVLKSACKTLSEPGKLAEALRGVLQSNPVHPSFLFFETASRIFFTTPPSVLTLTDLGNLAYILSTQSVDATLVLSVLLHTIFEKCKAERPPEHLLLVLLRVVRRAQDADSARKLFPLIDFPLSDHMIPAVYLCVSRCEMHCEQEALLDRLETVFVDRCFQHSVKLQWTLIQAACAMGRIGFLSSLLKGAPVSAEMSMSVVSMAVEGVWCPRIFSVVSSMDVPCHVKVLILSGFSAAPLMYKPLPPSALPDYVSPAPIPMHTVAHALDACLYPTKSPFFPKFLDAALQRNMPEVLFETLV
eukprot:TRINITY_DN38056_c0_g1_i1.p1 TRINITY_DN38056_c0_g1~~TRINITY_DN38056_c0_g1_i1.p1  ORF type:complete len:541 (+),score=65.91 TRINITY_DN38056_c0_g1_i1:66-1688(+)